jgi:hypothetical protein
MSEIEVGQKWQHKKRGSIYEIVHTTASIQCTSDLAVQAYEDEDWIAYRPIAGHALHFRLREEFLDGRFEKVDP